MKRYSFTLEGVLRARRAQEGVARSAFAVATSAARAAEAAASESLAHYETVTTTPREDLLAKQEQGALAARSLLEAQASSEQATAAAQAALAEYLEARRAVALLERLDSGRRAEHALAVQREEALLADEMTANRKRKKGVAGRK
jgi:hypothetical protein